MNDETQLRGLYAAFASADIRSFFSACATDLEWTELAGGVYGGTYRGQDEIVKMFMKVLSEWDFYRVIPETYFACGETIFVIGRYEGKHRASRKDFRAPFAHVWTMREGKAARFQTLTDTALQQAATQT